jgi:transcriptional regulator with XRE-family HTH domain
MFELIRARLLDCIRHRLSTGDLTERRLARLAGVSQPHLHNVLKGVRAPSMVMADRLIERLEIGGRELLGDLPRGPIRRS